MAVAGDIVANLTANTSGWSSGLKGAITPLNMFAAAALGLAAKGVSSFLSVGDQLDEMSARTGSSAEQLSKLGYAADMAGGSLDGIQAGLIKQAQFMEKVASGSTEATSTLARLGTTTTALAGLTADEKFVHFSGKLAAISDAGERSALAMKIFGKGAVDLLPLIASGEAGITSMMDEAEKLGLVMSTKDAKAAGEFGDSLDRLYKVGDALLRNVVAPVIPLLTHVANGLAAVAGENGDWISMLVKTGIVIATVVVAVKAVAIATQLYSKSAAIAQALSGPAGWATLAVGIAAAGVATVALNAEFEDMNGTLAATSDVTSSAASSAYELRDAYDAATENFNQTAASASYALKQEFDAMTATVDVTHTAAEAAAIAAAEIDTAIAKQAQLGQVATRLLDSAAGSLRTSAQAAQDESQKIFDAWVAGGADVAMRLEDVRKLQTGLLEDKSGFTDSLTNVSDELRILRGEITETELKFQQMAEFGVSDAQIQKLREAMAERDALLGTQKAELLAQQQAEQEAATLQAAKDAPADKPATAEQRRAVLTEAITVRSDAGQRQLVDLLNRKGGADPALFEAKKQTELAQLHNEKLDELITVAGKGQMQTKPFRGRS